MEVKGIENVNVILEELWRNKAIDIRQAVLRGNDGKVLGTFHRDDDVSDVERRVNTFLERQVDGVIDGKWNPHLCDIAIDIGILSSGEDAMITWIPSTTVMRLVFDESIGWVIVAFLESGEL